MLAARLPVSYGGASGSLAATMARCSDGATSEQTFGRVTDLLGHWADELGLELPNGVWHTDRVPVLRVASGYAQTTAARGYHGAGFPFAPAGAYQVTMAPPAPSLLPGHRRPRAAARWPRRRTR